MQIPSYKDKTYFIASNEARIRRAGNLNESEKYKAGDALPDGVAVGDFKKIPKRTEVKVSDVKVGASRTVFVFAEPIAAADANAPSGWTLASNLEGQLMNEIINFAPSDWEFAPSAETGNFTVTDQKALIRQGAPDYKSTGKTIAAGTYVLVTEKSKNPAGQFVKISRAVVAGGKISATDEIGWTAAANLTEGCTKFFGTDAWTNQKGANGCWRGGRFIGSKILVNIVGVGGVMEQITLESLEPYFKLRNAARQKNLDLGIESGFRTFQSQQVLFDLFRSGRGNLAAKPGTSNHQHGQAFDLNTRGFDGNPIYDWMKKNAPKLGFIRTVNKEHWHWEYLPEEAAAIAKNGGFATAKVKK